MPVTLEIIMDYSEQREQHIEDTRYLKWTDGMYVMLEDLECDYELALVENSLRDSVYSCRGDWVTFAFCFTDICLGVRLKMAGVWTGANGEYLKARLTRAQALYIATGDVSI